MYLLKYEDKVEYEGTDTVVIAVSEDIDKLTAVSEEIIKQVLQYKTILTTIQAKYFTRNACISSDDRAKLLKEVSDLEPLIPLAFKYSIVRDSYNTDGTQEFSIEHVEVL